MNSHVTAYTKMCKPKADKNSTVESGPTKRGRISFFLRVAKFSPWKVNRIPVEGQKFKVWVAASIVLEGEKQRKLGV